MAKINVYEMVTERIIEQLEKRSDTLGKTMDRC